MKFKMVDNLCDGYRQDDMRENETNGHEANLNAFRKPNIAYINR